VLWGVVEIVISVAGDVNIHKVETVNYLFSLESSRQPGMAKGISREDEESLGVNQPHFLDVIIEIEEAKVTLGVGLNIVGIVKVQNV
jgi:hypothetical protein